MNGIELVINKRIKKFKDNIKKLRGSLFNQNENPNKYYIEFSAKLQDLISKIDKDLEIIRPFSNEFKKVVEDLILQVANNEEDDESAPIIKKFNIENYNSEKTLEFIKTWW